MFSIPHFASFSIGKLDYRADNSQLSYTLKLLHVYLHLAWNFHLFPTLLAFENNQRLIAEINALKSRIDIPERHSIIRHAEDIMVIYFIVLLLTASFMFWKYMLCHFEQLRRLRSKFSPRSERVALSDIEGNVSDEYDAAPSSRSDKKTRRATGSHPNSRPRTLLSYAHFLSSLAPQFLMLARNF